MANINITIPDELHRKLRIASATKEKPQKEIIIEFLAAYAKKHGKH
ncbi:MAG: hypothetical protein ABIJ21_01125 [Nanoarchaeota archaeon]